MLAPNFTRNLRCGSWADFRISGRFPKQLNVLCKPSYPLPQPAKGMELYDLFWTVERGPAESSNLCQIRIHEVNSSIRSPLLSLSLPPSAMGLLFVPCLNMLSGSTWFNKQSIPREVFQGKDAIVRPYSWGKYDNSSKIIYAMFTTAKICTNIF